MDLDAEFDKIYGGSGATAPATDDDLDSEFDKIYGSAGAQEPSPAPRVETAAAPTSEVQAPKQPAPVEKTLPTKSPTLLERLANGDVEDELKRRDAAYNTPQIVGSSITGYQQNITNAKRDPALGAMDDLADMAKEAGLEDWQVKRIRGEAKSPDEMVEALKYVAGNRQRWLEAMPVQQEKTSGVVRNTLDIVPQVVGGAVAGTMTAIGTALGGDSGVEAPHMVDDPMAKRDGETFDHWYKRVQFNPMEKLPGETGKQFSDRIAADGKIREYAERFFKWEAPIAGKEGMRPADSVAFSEDKEKSIRQRVADAFVQGGRAYREFLDRRFPVGKTGISVVNWAQNAATGIGQFMYAGATMIPISAAESYQQAKEVALMSGKSESEATKMAAGKAAFDGLMTAAYWIAPFRRWANGKNITPIEPVKNFTFKELTKASGRFAAKKEFLNQAIAAGEASAIMGTQGAGDAAFEMALAGQDVDLGEVVVRGLEGVRDGAIIGAVMGAARIADARYKGAKEYDGFVRDVVKTPQGRLMLARMNPDGMMRLKAFLNEAADFAKKNAKPKADFEASTTGTAEAGRLPAFDWKPTPETEAKFRELCNKAGLPADVKLAADVLYDPRVANFLGDSLKTETGARAERGRTKISEKPTAPSEEIVDAETGEVITPSAAARKGFVQRFNAEPVEFNLPQTADGKPAITPFSLTNKASGKTYQNVVAHDPRTGVYINQNGDGSFTVFNDEFDCDDAKDLGEAVEKAKFLAVKNQYVAKERAEKKEVIDGLLEQKGLQGKVQTRPSMAAVLSEAKAGGIDLASKPGFRMDALSVGFPDGTTVLVLDNINDPATAVAALEVGTPADRGAFADGVKFETEASSDENGDLVETRVAKDEAHGVTIVDNGDQTFTVFNQKGDYANAESLSDAVAIANGKKPMVQRKETTHEARADEALPQSQEGAARRQEGEEVARPGAAEPPRAEAPREGVVEKPTIVHNGEQIVPPKVQDKTHLDMKVDVARAQKKVESLPDDVLPKAKKDVIARRLKRVDEALEEGGLDDNGVVKTIAQSLFVIKSRLVDMETGEYKEGAEGLGRHIDRLLGKLSDNGITVVDHTGRKADIGDAVNVIAVEKRPGLKNDEYVETISPTIRRNNPDGSTTLVSMGEVIVGTPAASAENRAEAPAKPAEARPAVETSKDTPAPEKPVETASGASEVVVSKNATTTAPTAEEVKAAEAKAKRDAIRQATREKAAEVPPPDFLANRKAGDPNTRVQTLVDYLGDKNHNRPSLTQAINMVRDYYTRNRNKLGFFTDDGKRQLVAAIGKAVDRAARMRDQARAEFGQMNADLPRNLVEKYVESYPGSILEIRTDKDGFFKRPRSAAAAKKSVGVKNPLVDAKFDGKLFDPDAEGADALNIFFDGMAPRERDKWLRILFGNGTKTVNEPVVTGIDATLADMMLTMDEALDAIRKEVESFQKWREEGAEDEESRHYREQYEEEQAALDDEFGPIDDFRIAELEARGAADLEYSNAKAFVENRATAKDVAVYSPEALSAAKEGDEVRIDHQKKTYNFVNYDAKNGILTVSDFVDFGDERTVRFQVTEDGIRQLQEETNDTTAETGPSDNVAPDAQGARAAGGEEEGGGAAGGHEVRAAEDAARTGKADAYRRVAEAIDPAWQAAHPEEVKNRIFPVSAVASNPLVKGGTTDAVSWPIDATKIDNQEDAANLFRVISDPGYEITKVLYVDDFGNITGRKVVAIGTVGNVNVNFGDIFSKVPMDTTGVILSHNHPAEQGDEVKPSDSDGPVTQNIKKACEKNGLKLYDHIVTDHNAYYSYAAADPSYVSEGAAKFWEQADVFGGMVEKPADTMNIVPFGERIDMRKDTVAKLNGMAALVSKSHDGATWVAGIDDKGKVVWVDAVPSGGDLGAFAEAHTDARRFAVFNGAEKVDMPSFVDAIERGWNGNPETRPLVIATGENGEINAYEPNGLNDRILAAAKPAAPAAKTPRLANAPKLDGDAQKTGLDILSEFDGLLMAPVAPLGNANPGTIAQRVPPHERRAFRAEFNKILADYAHHNNGALLQSCGLFTSDNYYIFDIIDGEPTGIERLAINDYNRDRIRGLDRKYKSEIYKGTRNSAYWAARFRNELSGYIPSGDGVGDGERGGGSGGLDSRQAGRGGQVSDAAGDTSAGGSETQPVDGVLSAPVAPLDEEQTRKLRDAAEKLMKHLAANGYGTFDDMVRFIAANRPEVYERLKDPLRRAWNWNVTDPADEISFARGNEIFGKIDAELKEAPNGGEQPQQVRTGADAAERDRGRIPAVDSRPDVPPGGRGTNDAVRGDGSRQAPGSERREDRADGGRGGQVPGPGGREGLRGDTVADGTGLESGSRVPGEAQRDSEGGVHELNEVSPGFSEYEPPADLPVKAPKSQSLIVESSALASIQPPKIKSKPDIPDSIPEKGILQAHQYQAVCQAVDANNEKLPNGQRQGYLCGDGTGAGKTRIIAGVMLDAMNRNLGNGKALIISKNKELLESAQSDFEPFGIADRLFELNDKGRLRLAQNGKGIAFTTYDSLATNYRGMDAEGNVLSAGKRGKSDNRFAELVKWLGKGFDGVIALDEAHSAGKGELVSEVAQATRAAAAVDLQNALPNARVLYLTATAAYDANHLKFLTRAGLWGEGTGFRTLSDFANAVNQGGLSMMEILTQGLKAKGLYCSRSISFKGVKCNRVVAQTTPEQKETYGRYSEALSRIHDAAIEVGEIVGVSTRQQSRQYFGRMLDLFNSLITSMKVQKAIELGKQAIAEGKSPVFQIIMTNESARDAKAAKMPKKQTFDLFGNVVGETPVEADEVEVGVKDRILAYLNGGGFPVRENLGKGPDGKPQWGEIMPEAVALRDEMIELVNALPDVANPIDELTKAFADVGISRITGKSNKNAEAAKFNDGENLALVFSGAGGTGASYHADRRFKNQRQRVQIPIEFGWEPEKFLQALGRSHRNNQVVPPEFVLLTTDIAGEMRFMSTIANRVASMGAIVGGDRNSSGQVVSATDSVDTTYGRAAIRDVMRKLGSGLRIGDMSPQEVLDSMFINPDKLDKVEPNQFLGRMQFLPIDEQSAIYNEIADRIERSVAAAKADGTYDDGIRKIDAKRLDVKSAEPMSTGETQGQTRSLITTSEWYDSRRIDHEALEARAPGGRTVEYVRNKRSGRLYGLFQNGQNFVRLAPDGSYETVLPLERGNYESVGRDEGRKAWDAEYEKLPAEVERNRRYMSGDLIPVWDKIGVEGRPFVYRAQPQNAKPFIGLYIPDAQLPVTLWGFGKKAEARKFFDENAYRLVAHEGAKFGLGASGNADVSQPYFKKMRIGTRNVLAVVHAEGTPVEADLSGGGWDNTWAKDESNYQDRGGTVYYREFGDEAEAAFKDIVKKHGVVIYRGEKPVFESRDGISARAAAAILPRTSERPVRGTSAAANPAGRTLGERVGMPQMRMRVENGQVYITNTDPRHKNDLKLAFGGQWAHRVRDGKRYVKSDLRWNQDASGRGGFWSIPLEKVPPQILVEIEESGELRSTVAPLESVAQMEQEGGLVRLAQNPLELKTAFVHNMLRASVAPLEDAGLAVLSEGELVRRATDEGDMSAVGELYKRYMKPNAANGGLRGLIRRAAARKGMTGVLTADRIEDVASLVWGGVATDGAHYEERRNGIIADLAGGHGEIYRNAKSLIPAMTEKIDRILNDMAERAKKRPEMLSLDKPNASREGESELDQQIADEPSVAENLLSVDQTSEYVEPAATAEDVIAGKLGDVAHGAGRRLSRGERSRIEAMDMLDETMFFLPDELQDVMNAVLTEERKRGFTDKGASRVDSGSLAAAQKASGLPPQVFAYRYRTAKAALNEIWNNIRSGKSDENIAIKAREIEGLGETDEEINEDILDNLDLGMDARRVIQLLLDGEAVSDIADAFKLPPALVRAWRARARNEYGLKFPEAADENPLGLDLGEPGKAERKARGPRKERPSAKAWTPDLFAAANATVNDVQNEKISAGIAAGANDAQIAEDVGIDPALVKLQRIRERTPSATPGEKPFDMFAHLRNKPRQDSLFAPVEPLEQGTLGIGSGTQGGPLGYTNAAANEWRVEHGFAEIAKKAKVSLDDLNRQGAAMANNAREMDRMVERLTRAPYAVSPVEQVALGQYVVALERQFNKLYSQKQEAFANGNEGLAAMIDLDAQNVFKRLDAAQRINNRVVGNQLGLAMRARQMTLNEDGSIADYMVSCTNAKGGPLTKGERAQAEKLFAQLDKANIALDDATTAAMIEYLDALSKRRLAAANDEVKELKKAKKEREIERDYFEALAQIRYHGEKRSGGTLHGLPGGQKWIRALEAYHLMNGEGLVDGKPDAAKMVELVLKDIHDQGVDATAWDVRQMESRMGNLVRPSQDEISKSLRDLHSQMLVTQQMEHMLETGEMPPKTGVDRDEDSAAVRALRRERDRMMRKLGINRKTADELLKTALDAYKTRTRNQIEEMEKAIADVEAGRPYEKDERRKLQLDDEAQALKDRRNDLKKRLDELTRDPAKEYEKKVERAMDSLAKTIAVRKEQVAAMEAGTFDFDAKAGEKVASPKLEEMRNELKELNKRKDELKKALYPFGTDAEIARRNKQRMNAAKKSLDRWHAMAAEYEAAKSWEDRAKAVAPSERRVIPETPELAEKRRIRDEARAKVAEYRRQLQRDDTRGANADAWMKFLKSVPRIFWTYLDMSVAGVQGGKFMVSHPARGAVSAAKATASFFSDAASARLAKEIGDHPYFEDFKKHGGHIYDMEGLRGEDPEYFEAVGRAKTLPGAQKIMGLVSKLPGAKAVGRMVSVLKPIERSRRSFSGFLNSAGLELYRCMVEAAGKDGTGATDNVKKDIAKFVNISLGYGYDKIEDEKGLMRALSELADALAFAPRKSVSEIKYFIPGYVQYTNWSGSRRHEKSGKEIRLANKLTGREQVRFLLGSLAFGVCGLLLASLVNKDEDDDNLVSDILDPRSPSFGRVTIGKTRFSFLGGGDMVWRFLARLATGSTKRNGVVSDKSREDVVKEYVRGRANPLLSVAWDLATGRDFAGKDIADRSVGETVMNYGLPITARAEVENFMINDPLTALVNLVPIFYGFNKSTYETSPLERVAAQGAEAVRQAKAAADIGDEDTARRIEGRVKEREQVYGAAKGVKSIEQKIKNLEKRAKMYKYTLDRTKKGENPTLEKNYAEVTKGIEELKAELERERKKALEAYRATRKEQKWDDMGWTK